MAELRENMRYEERSLQGLSQEALYDRLRVLCGEVENNDLSGEELSESLGEMVDLNPSLEVCKGIKHYKITNGYDCSLVLLLFFCHKQVNDDDDRVSFHDIEQIFSESMDYQHVRRMLKSGRHELLHKKIIVQNRTTDLVSREYFGLSDEAKGVLMSELNLEMKSDREDKHLLRHGDIVEKALFYNDAERDEVAQLAELLSEKHFAWIQRRLKRSGMRSGFACLFYGAPGTGKTETVYQLARQTGRDIIMVNVSEIKSMWVGESEKNIKGLFDRYRAYCKHCERIPILLFNEADAVLGTRQENVQRAVDKMENSIQNIILQEMETLDGIMIATTNLTENLDKAFERRFLYKIAFMKPCIEAKTSIWQSMMPKLSDVIAEELSRCYDFSGGEIENIVRRATIEHILKGKRPTLEVLHRYCKGEKMERGNRHKRVGF